jgi:hypothetical protein
MVSLGDGHLEMGLRSVDSGDGVLLQLLCSGPLGESLSVSVNSVARLAKSAAMSEIPRC